jgi:hypothetical protein
VTTNTGKMQSFKEQPLTVRNTSPAEGERMEKEDGGQHDQNLI